MDNGRGYDPNMIYGSSYFDAIDRLSADSLKAYYTYLHSPAREAWQKLWKPTSFAGKEFYYDLMGTRLLRECRFAEAIPYLEKRASPSSRRKTLPSMPPCAIIKSNVGTAGSPSTITIPRWSTISRKTAS